MMRRPDEDHDVIVHQFRERDGQDIWTIWLAGDKKGARVSLRSISPALWPQCTADRRGSSTRRGIR